MQHKKRMNDHSPHSATGAPVPPSAARSGKAAMSFEDDDWGHEAPSPEQKLLLQLIELISG